MPPQGSLSPNTSLFPRRSHIVATVQGTHQGPTLLGVGCTHGNEPAGLMALLRVAARLAESPHRLKGRFVALHGNLSASQEDRRFLARDLNRIWTQEHLHHLAHQTLDLHIPEHREQSEIYQDFQDLIASAQGKVFAMDLHTSSAPSAPFVIVSPRPATLHYASQLHAPLIFGLEELLSGTMMKHLCDLGHITLGFEAGQHQDPQSVQCHEAILWSLLHLTGMIQAHDFPDIDQQHQILQQAAQHVPPALEVFYRHAITQEDAFSMLPGFANFDPVQKGQALARDRNGTIYAHDDGYIFLPLYQGQGNDGFFLVRNTDPHPGLD